MNLIILSWNYIRSKPLNTLLNMLLMALGIAIILVLILLSSQLEENLNKNKRGVDLVVGAKGSPLQLILANVYHIDFPTGNIKLEEARALTRNRLIAGAIPLALGDNYRGFRIVGTNHEYVQLYEGSLTSGQLWKRNMESVIGANVAERLNLKPGDTFFGAHGLSVADMEHEERPYKIVGVLGRNNSVLDNLILTNIESVWAVHEHEEEHEHSEHADEPELGSAYESGLPEGDEDAEITSMLLKFRSPMGAVTLPRMINSNTNMQAASPAFETQRLFSLLGIGVELLRSFAYIIIIIAGLSIFISLYNALKDRKYDLAIMRSLGASKTKLFVHVILEGVIITVLGGALGFVLGHGLTEFLAGLYEKSEAMGLTGLVFVKQEWWVVVISIGIGLLASVIPAVNAYKTDISDVLAKE
ncbi:MAG: ABC transporter permease [Bacteroidota bacterium]|uniref:Peptide ABC transporter permease n=1 Tax=Roseivirga thermotolerans TaxID=1758176 RepID=A0ABQ3I3V2_9BACT|nr:ABC transporter permease [Roseivirga thermotolerans]MEC7753090.1 ABC transporter permease [Bacteroidota bacterium]GHE52001.1 peptide ABC transporter permease [Roseivirga thermotolerans]